MGNFSFIVNGQILHKHSSHLVSLFTIGDSIQDCPNFPQTSHTVYIIPIAVTSSYFKQINFVADDDDNDNVDDADDADLNILFVVAMERLPALPFFYMVSKYLSNTKIKLSIGTSH